MPTSPTVVALVISAGSHPHLNQKPYRREEEVTTATMKVPPDPVKATHATCTPGFNRTATNRNCAQRPVRSESEGFTSRN